MDTAPAGGKRARLGRRRLVWIALALLVILGLALAVRFWFAPLGPGLAAATGHSALATAPAGTAQPADTGSADPATQATAVAPAAGEQAAAPANVPNCGESGLMRLLVLGSDARTDDYTTGRADFIRAVRADFGTGTVCMLSIPRDLWLPIPNLAEHGVAEDRINAAYSLGNYYHLPGGGESLTAETLQQAFGLAFDHYLIVNFAAAEAGIDAIGGLDIDLPKDVDGTGQDLPYFEAGPNHMDGATLLQYVRVRFTDSDLYRIDRQNQVLVAVRAKLLTPQVVGAVPGLLDAMSALIYTDLSPAQLSSLACLGQSIGLGAIATFKIDEPQLTHFTTDQGASVLLPQYALIAPIIAAFTAEQP
jgi:polyisoprenyl-teichoic acid--peptidoglycan teichoic acid transferase